MPLAEYNRGIMRFGWADPRMAGFVDNLERVNTLADRADGFVWRLAGDKMELAQADRALGGHPRLAATLSVWRDADALEAFVFRTIHDQFLKRGPEWFEPAPLRLVLWEVPRSHKPDVTEAWERFQHLERHGDSEFAFGWETAHKRFTATS
jgi:hypothetical protein